MKASAILLGLLGLALEASAITCTPNTPPCSELCSPTDYLCCGASYVCEPCPCKRKHLDVVSGGPLAFKRLADIMGYNTSARQPRGKLGTELVCVAAARASCPSSQ
jgi:hypothetical protein